MGTYQSYRSRASVVHRLQVLLHPLRHTSSHCPHSSLPVAERCELGRRRSARMRLGCCSHPVRSRILLVVEGHHSRLVVVRNRGQGSCMCVRQCAGSRKTSGYRANPIPHTTAGRLAVAGENVAAVGTASNRIAAVDIAAGHPGQRRKIP